MVKTIGNPLTWLAQGASGTGRAMGSAAEALGSELTEIPETNILTTADIRAALRAGFADFSRFRSDVMFLVLIYPAIGLALSVMAFHEALLPMIFPMAAGFLLLGPVAAIGLYQMSRKAETQDNVHWGTALTVLQARNIGPVLAMALYLLAIFAVWMFTALQIYGWTLGPEPPASLSAFVTAVFTTQAGWTMIVIGMAVGFVFAALVLVISLISLPMLIDKHTGVPIAVATSLQVARENPVTVGLWGALVAVLMVIGTIPFFLGLIIVLPVLGHATWYLYRAAVPAET